MDYEKKYKEALERARIWKEKSGMPKNRQGILDDIFPELKESEDERMRKALKEYFINSFQNNGVAAICGVHIKDILAWLEKQVEQKPAELSNDDKQYLTVCKNALFKYQVSDKWDATIISQWLENKVKQAVTQPKQEWSEEDNDMLYKVVHRIEQLDHYWNAPTDEKMIDWLKSLKDRVQPQPVQEWSKEDRKLIDDTCNLINTLASGYGEKVTEPITFSGCKQITGIKESLRALVDNKPISHWRPSDEQMKVLNECLNFAANHESPHWNNYIFGTLNNLIRQLKKLREE